VGRQEGAAADVAAAALLRSTEVVLVVIAHLLNKGEADRNDSRRTKVVLSSHPRKDQCVEGEHAA
jgi:hypothetical protein